MAVVVDTIVIILSRQRGNMNITLYTSHCPSCKVIEMKLERKNIQYVTIDDTDAVVKFGEEHGIKSAPILVVDDQIYDLKAANDWIKTI